MRFVVVLFWAIALLSYVAATPTPSTSASNSSTAASSVNTTTATPTPTPTTSSATSNSTTISSAITTPSATVAPSPTPSPTSTPTTNAPTVTPSGGTTTPSGGTATPSPTPAPTPAPTPSTPSPSGDYGGHYSDHCAVVHNLSLTGGIDSLIVITYNVQMFPEYVGVNRDNYGRVAGIVSGLLALEVDVVMLQEVWDSAPFTAFTGNLSSTLPYIADITPAVLLPNRSLTSGLWFGSRYPILLQDFHQYDNAGPYEELASKGVYGALLNVSGTLTLAFNTHLYSPDGTSDGSVRALQLQEARLFIDSMLNQSQSYGVVSHIVWGGDFNTAESDTSQYQTLLSTTNAFDLFRAAYPSEPGYTFSSWNPSKRIDYIFAIDSNASVTVNNASVQCFAGYIGPSNSSYNPCLSLEAQSCCSACEAASDATHSCGWCEGSGSAAVNLCLDSALLNSFCSSASGVVKDNCSAPAPEPDCQELYHDCASCIAAVSLRANDTACVWCGSDGAPGICLTNLPYASIICTIGVNGSLYGEPFNSTCPTGAQPTPVGPSCPTPSPPSGVTDTTSLSSAVSSVGNSTNTGNSNEGSNSSSFSVEASKCGGLDHCGLWALVAIGLLVLLLMIVALIVAMVVKRGKSPSTNDESPEGSSSSDYDEE